MHDKEKKKKVDSPFSHMYYRFRRIGEVAKRVINGTGEFRSAHFGSIYTEFRIVDRYSKQQCH